MTKARAKLYKNIYKIFTYQTLIACPQAMQETTPTTIQVPNRKDAFSNSLLTTWLLIMMQFFKMHSILIILNKGETIIHKFNHIQIILSPPTCLDK